MTDDASIFPSRTTFRESIFIFPVAGELGKDQHPPLGNVSEGGTDLAVANPRKIRPSGQEGLEGDLREQVSDQSRGLGNSGHPLDLPERSPIVFLV